MQDSLEFYYQLENVLNDIIVNETDIPYVYNVRTIGQAGFEIKTGLTKEDEDFEYILILLDSKDDTDILSFKALFQSYDSVWEDINFTAMDDITHFVDQVSSGTIYAFTADKEVIFPSLEAIAIIFEKVLALYEDKADA